MCTAVKARAQRHVRDVRRRADEREQAGTRGADRVQRSRKANWQPHAVPKPSPRRKRAPGRTDFGTAAANLRKATG
jgi:hypothetical protein